MIIDESVFSFIVWVWNFNKTFAYYADCVNSMDCLIQSSTKECISITVYGCEFLKTGLNSFMYFPAKLYIVCQENVFRV